MRYSLIDAQGRYIIHDQPLRYVCIDFSMFPHAHRLVLTNDENERVMDCTLPVAA